VFIFLFIPRKTKALKSKTGTHFTSTKITLKWGGNMVSDDRCRGAWTETEMGFSAKKYP